MLAKETWKQVTAQNTITQVSTDTFNSGAPPTTRHRMVVLMIVLFIEPKTGPYPPHPPPSSSGSVNVYEAHPEGEKNVYYAHPDSPPPAVGPRGMRMPSSKHYGGR